jgi:hypothetical protein
VGDKKAVVSNLPPPRFRFLQAAEKHSSEGQIPSLPAYTILSCSHKAKYGHPREGNGVLRGMACCSR